MTELHDRLSKRLLKTRDRLLDVCDELDININDVDESALLVCQCTGCSIWAGIYNTKQDSDGMVLCDFCYDIDTLRF